MENTIETTEPVEANECPTITKLPQFSYEELDVYLDLCQKVENYYYEHPNVSFTLAVIERLSGREFQRPT